MGSAPVDQQSVAQPAAGLRLFIDGGEVGLDPKQANCRDLDPSAVDRICGRLS